MGGGWGGSEVAWEGTKNEGGMEADCGVMRSRKCTMDEEECGVVLEMGGGNWGCRSRRQSD